jgi:hypothetical protein
VKAAYLIPWLLLLGFLCLSLAARSLSARWSWAGVGMLGAAGILLLF